MKLYHGDPRPPSRADLVLLLACGAAVVGAVLTSPTAVFVLGGIAVAWAALGHEGKS